MKYLLLISILLLSSCTQYRYNVTYEKCNGQTGSVSYNYELDWFDMFWQEQAPYLYILSEKLYYPYGRITKVCDFSYTRNPIE